MCLEKEKLAKEEKKLEGLVARKEKLSSDIRAMRDEMKSQKHRRGSSKDDGIVRDNVAESRGETSGVQQCNSFFLIKCL